MSGANEKYVVACPKSELPRDGTVIVRRIERQTVLLAFKEQGSDVVVAFEPTCPHAFAPLRFGKVINGEIICPWHFFRFNVETGCASACDHSRMQLRTFPTKIVGDDIHVSI